MLLGKVINRRRTGYTTLLKVGINNYDKPFYVLARTVNEARQIIRESNNKYAIPLTLDTLHHYQYDGPIAVDNSVIFDNTKYSRDTVQLHKTEVVVLEVELLKFKVIQTKLEKLSLWDRIFNLKKTIQWVKREFVQLAVKSTDKIRSRIKFPVWVQPKLNGVRGLIEYKVPPQYGDDLFANSTEREVVISSSEGNRYRITHLEEQLLPFFIDNPNTILDGEIYIHDTPLNEIIRRLPKTRANGTVTSTSLPVEDLEFWIFDVKSDEIQHKRIDELTRLDFAFGDAKYKSIVVLSSIWVFGLKELEDLLDLCIERDYEGIIYRFPSSHYSPGSKKVSVMGKWKKAQDTECTLISIIDEGWKDNVYVIKMLLQNDINNETFLCNVGDDDRHRGKWTNEYKQALSGNFSVDPTRFIGKLVTVKFYERSGVIKCPFHANVVAIRDYE